jgi:hypothetical protein
VEIEREEISRRNEMRREEQSSGSEEKMRKMKGKDERKIS